MSYEGIEHGKWKKGKNKKNNRDFGGSLVENKNLFKKSQQNHRFVGWVKLDDADDYLI